MTRRLHTLTDEEIRAICRDAFGTEVTVGGFLAGEVAVNVRVTDAAGRALVLKAEYPSPAVSPAHYDWVCGVQERARSTGLPVADQIPATTPTGDTGFLALVPIGSTPAPELPAGEAPSLSDTTSPSGTPTAMCRLQGFLPGSVVRDREVDGGHEALFGRVAARTVSALADHPSEPEPVLHPWAFEPTGANVLFACDRIASLEAAGAVPAEFGARTSADLALARRIAERFQAEVRPRLADLPHQVVHQDLNDFNLLVADGRLSGIIDFGDARWAPRVAELGVAAAYATLGTDSPVGGLLSAIGAYRTEALGGRGVQGGRGASAAALTVDEYALVPLAALTRLCLNACQWTARTLTTPADDPRHAYGRARMERSWPVIRDLAGPVLDGTVEARVRELVTAHVPTGGGRDS
ncbi:phosphotransferase [Brevibacterium litoralis]|uniref:phosphotransferase n=1 Tax=Brevibacterium litoralis TaxID=3138935 RepID=UPI0032EAE530